MATITPISVPPKKLAQSITSASSSFKVNNIKSWARNSLGVNINLTAGDFGTRAFCVFRNDTGTKIEIMEIDPATIASTSITILKRGMGFGGDLTTETTNYKLDWSANETTINFGTDVPQLFQLIIEAVAARGYILTMGTFSSISPADATTYYFGNPVASITTNEGFGRIYIPKAGTIKAAYINFLRFAGNNGSNEVSTVSIRLNGTTDYQVTAALTLDDNSLSSGGTNLASNTSLSIPVVAGDYIEIKWLTATWVTNPTIIRPTGSIYIE